MCVCVCVSVCLCVCVSVSVCVCLCKISGATFQGTLRTDEWSFVFKECIPGTRSLPTGDLDKSDKSVTLVPLFDNFARPG